MISTIRLKTSGVMLASTACTEARIARQFLIIKYESYYEGKQYHLIIGKVTNIIVKKAKYLYR